MSEVALNRGNVAGLVNNVLTHSMLGVVGRVAPYPGKLTHLIPNRIDSLAFSRPLPLSCINNMSKDI